MVQPGRGYAVIDFETTGFSALTTDRVVEIGVVCLDHSGEVTEEWTTLVNPERDVGAGLVHGLTARDVYDAPRFAQIAGLLADSLRDRVVVAHNLAFEARFLIGEYGRLGHELRLDRTCGICTMTLAGTYIPRSPRNLRACCDCCGVELRDAHTALADALATAQLLGRYQSVDRGFAARWADRLDASLAVRWPPLAAGAALCVPRGAAAASAGETYVGRLAAHLPAVGGAGVAYSYFEVLDRALIDRILSLHEMDELIRLACDLGLSKEQAIAAHQEYLRALARQAWADGVVTDEQIADLVSVADQLGIAEADVHRALLDAEGGVAEGGPPACRPPVGAFSLQLGDRIVFTGEVPGVSREQLCEDAARRGLTVMTSVSRKTRVVVAADPDSLSGKARRARECGVPVIEIAAYLKLRTGVRLP